MKEILGTDINGRVDYSLPQPTSCYNGGLEANTIKEIVTPPNFNRAFFSYASGADVWITFNGDDPVLIPGGGWTTSQELNPGVRQLDINGGQTIKFLSEADCYVNVRYDLGAD